MVACGAPEGTKGVCATLPACMAPAPPENAYGEACATAVDDGWRGRPVCCAGGLVIAECITRALGGQLCDPTEPISCAYPLRCGEDPSCSGSCCVP